MNLYLIGYRGSGKTTVAQQVALALGWAWDDLDVEIERAAGKSITEVFAAEGEPGFRQREAAALRTASHRDRQVLALGGGVILRPENRDVLRNTGKAIWLKASSATLLQRIEADPVTAARRPNLTAAGGLAEIETLLAQRTEIYRLCADLVVDTDDKPPEAVAAEILDHLPTWNISGKPA